MGESTQATGGNRTTEVIRAATVQDVTEAVIQAAAEAVHLVVVGGGHSVWARTDVGGLRLELADLADVQVDGTIVRVGGGATWGQVAAELADHGLAISSGDTSTVGVGGLTTGGGIGWMVRMWGLAADQLIGAQVVTATGEVIETSALHEPELFWALRGGGGNFGVVTRFDFQAHPLPGIAFAEGVIDGDAAEVLRATRDLMEGAPRQLTVTYMDVPSMDPSAPAGARLSAVWAGPEPERLQAVLAPVAELSGVAVEITTPAYRDILMEMPAPDAESAPPGFIGGNGLFRELDDALIDQLVAFRQAHPASVLFLRSLGGAFADVAQDDSAFPARDATWFVLAGGVDIPGLIDDAERAALAREWAAIAAGRRAQYANFADQERHEDVPTLFDGAALTRLRALKRTWDPRNVFRRNHNIDA
ncbi:FAD-binding oxidoreductase [Microbacterium keratanolyticum]